MIFSKFITRSKDCTIVQKRDCWEREQRSKLKSVRELIE